MVEYFHTMLDVKRVTYRAETQVLLQNMIAAFVLYILRGIRSFMSSVIFNIISLNVFREKIELLLRYQSRFRITNGSYFFEEESVNRNSYKLC